MSDTECLHMRVMCSITCVQTFPVTPEDDGVILVTQQDMRRLDVVQVETTCLECRQQRVLDDDEWEVV